MLQFCGQSEPSSECTGFHVLALQIADLQTARMLTKWLAIMAANTSLEVLASTNWKKAESLRRKPKAFAESRKFFAESRKSFAESRKSFWRR